MKVFKIIPILALGLLFLSQAMAQPAYVPFHTEPYFEDLGVHDGLVMTDRELFNEDGTIAYTAEDFKHIKETVRAGAAPWMQLTFDDVNLGDNSYLVITSHFDQDKQYFNAKSLAEWHNHSAYFKGGAVDLDLYVAPNDKRITLEVVGLTVGEFIDDDPSVLDRSQCGATDDRSPSGMPEFDGRLMTFGCTGWLTNGGFFITAGHCEALFSSSTIMEYHVPASLCNGTTQPAAVTNQYPVNNLTSVGQNAGVGDDYGVYSVNPNSNTGLLPGQRERAYYHLSKTLVPASMRIRGFGVDDTPPGCSGGRNAANQTLQWHAGASLGETYVTADDIYWQYLVDTEGGNSGSAISAYDATWHSVGVHTHGGCNDPIAGNKGTSIEANDFEIATNTFWQSQVEYVDVDHHGSYTVGSTVYPHYLLQNALNQANAGHGAGRELIMIAGSNDGSGGVYPEKIVYSGATHGVMLRCAAGAIKIGPGATPSLPPENSSDEASGNIKTLAGQPASGIHAPIDMPESEIPAYEIEEYAKVYPNPFADQATLEFYLKEGRTLNILLLNSIGQLTRVLESQDVRAAGLHKIDVDATTLPAGMYHVVLEAKGFRQVCKISVIN